jgi:hypothetical protein
MPKKVSGWRWVPIVLLIVSSLWTVAITGPLFYSLLFPTKDSQHIVRALEGRETLNADLSPLLQATSSAGQLKRAIQVGAYFHASADYNAKESHTEKTIQLSYLAWFEKRSKPTILVITRTLTDGSRLRFDISEDEPSGLFRAYLIPLLALTASAFWLWRSLSFRRGAAPD